MKRIGWVGLGSALAALVTASNAQAQDVVSVSSGDTAWILASTALVLLMTLPGLALFYGGLVRSKNVLSVMAQCVGIACLGSVLWLLGGYSLSFSGTQPLIGDLAKFALNAVPRAALVGTIPENVFFSFQMAFAVITPALIIGATVERMKFSAVMIFSGLWLLVVYAPVCHWVWGGGWLMGRSVMDYAGGLVVHATAGVSALLLAWQLGPRDGYPRDLHPPHNPGMTMMGAGLLWVGWYGFNGGSALAANADAGAALLATHMSASAAGLVWALIEWKRFGRVSMVGLVTGVVAGLATVTPASGFISPLAGAVLGGVGSLVCYHSVEMVRHRLKIDDSLDVFAVHGIGGIVGTLLVAVMASPTFGGKGYGEGIAMSDQALTQTLGVLAVCGWSAIATLGLVWIVRKTVGLRVSPETIDDGLDMAVHGEKAYRSIN